MAEVLTALRAGDVIETYPDDLPYPSVLLLGSTATGPIHLVVAADSENKRGIIVTVYRPDPLEWEPGFRKRRSP